MGAAWPELEELIRDLGEVCALPHAEGEPALSTATMAVTKATTALARAAGARGRSARTALAQARTAVDEARQALRDARSAINAAAPRRPTRPRDSGPATAGPVAGEADASCPACGGSFVVRYRASTAAPLVAFPVACPLAACDGLAEVEYPASAVEVVVEALPRP